MTKDKVKKPASTRQHHRMALGAEPSPAKFGKSGGTKNIEVKQKRSGKRGRG